MQNQPLQRQQQQQQHSHPAAMHHHTHTSQQQQQQYLLQLQMQQQQKQQHQQRQHLQQQQQQHHNHRHHQQQQREFPHHSLPQQHHQSHHHHHHPQRHHQQQLHHPPHPPPDQELDDLLDVLEYIRSRWNPSHTAQQSVGKRILLEHKRDYALSLARAVDLAIAQGDRPNSDMLVASGGARRSASSQTMTHPQGLNASAAAEPSNALQYQQQPYLQQLQESKQHAKQRQLKQQQRRLQQQQQEEEQEPSAACPSPVLDISEASALLVRTAATAKRNEAAASIVLLAGIPLPIESDKAAAAARNVDGGGSGQASGTEKEGKDSHMQYSDLEEFELFMMAVQRANGGEAGGKGQGKKEDMRPLRFHDDPKWYFVRCAVPWTGQVGITVVNAMLPVGGRHRHVLSVSAVGEEGSGYRAGVRAGDCITKVEGRDVTGMPCAELMSTLQDLLRARKQIDHSMTLEFIVARSLPRQSTYQGTTTGSVVTVAAAGGAATGAATGADAAAPGATASSSSSLSSSACTNSSTSASTASNKPHFIADTATVSRDSSSGSTDKSCLSSSSSSSSNTSSSSSYQLVGADSSFSNASVMTSVAAISPAESREGEMDIDDKSTEGGTKAHHHKTKASETLNLNEVQVGDGKNEEKKETGVVETKQKDEGKGEGESRRRRVREPGSAEKESPSKRRLRGTASTSSECMDEEDQQYQQQQKLSRDGAPNSQNSSSRSSCGRVNQGTWKEQSAGGKEVGTLAWARFEKLPKWPCRVEKVVEEPVTDGGKDRGKEMRQMAVVHFFGDAGPEKVPVASLELFEANFKRLYKRRHEKIYVRAVSQACVYLTTQKGLDATQLARLLGVPASTLEAYMQDAAAHKMLNSGSKRRMHHHTASQGEREEGEAEYGEGAGFADIKAYHVDSDQLHDTKVTGIFTEAWF